MKTCEGYPHRALVDLPESQFEISDRVGRVVALCADCFVLAAVAVLNGMVSEATEPFLTLPSSYSRGSIPKVQWAHDEIHRMWLLGKAALYLTTPKMREHLVLIAINQIAPVAK